MRPADPRRPPAGARIDVPSASSRTIPEPARVRPRSSSKAIRAEAADGEEPTVERLRGALDLPLTDAMMLAERRRGLRCASEGTGLPRFISGSPEAAPITGCLEGSAFLAVHA
jgi:hypothetical protein